METPGKRKFLGGQNGSNKSAKLGGASGGKMSFAQKMMAKMGYVEGQGLGVEGEGMVNPIEIKMRPQGVGVGAVKEKTQQYKDEQRRAAERRGEEYEDSSDEERRARRDRRKRAQGTTASASGSNTPAREKKAKPKYRTVADIQAAAPGLEVPPQMLSSILDATGSETKLLTSTAGLMQSGGLLAETEAEKIAKREKLELEAYIEAWHGLQEQKVYIGEHEGQHQIELDQHGSDIEKLQSLVDSIERLKQAIAYTTAVGEDISHRWSAMIEELSALQINHKHDLERYDVPEAAIGAVAPLFKKQLMDWHPLEEPEFLIADLERIKVAVGFGSPQDVAVVHSLDLLNIDTAKPRQRKATSPYETLMYTVWIPKVRTVITNWDVLEPAPLCKLVQVWRPLLPDFVYSNLVERLVVPRLVEGLETWDPRKRAHRHRHVTLKHAEPHTWLFPWLPLLPAHHLDMNASSGLAVDLKRRLKQILDTWDVGNGVMSGLAELREIVHNELNHILIRHLLPKLARHLSQHFEVDPSDQDLTPLEKVLEWQQHFKTEVFARLLVAEFFPKWLSTLHMWLVNDEAIFEEVREWVIWWKSQIPVAIREHPDVMAEWRKGDEMIRQALDLRARGKVVTMLPAPAAGPARPIAQEVRKKLDAQAAAAARHAPVEIQAQSFKDVVEAWCADEDLTLLPLREADPATGAPLFRISASATGKGGVVVYIKGDMLWGQRKNDRTSYELLGLDEKLVRRAEGK